MSWKDLESGQTDGVLAVCAGVEIFGQMSGRKAEANAQAARKHLESHQYLGSNNGGQAVMQEATPCAMWLLTN